MSQFQSLGLFARLSEPSTDLPQTKYKRLENRLLSVNERKRFVYIAPTIS